jgi:4-aminobutyrate aminotransferase-like enzyme
MIALELVTDRSTREPATALAAETVAAARERGLLLLACGLYSNVIRILVPLVVESDDLEHGLGILEDSLVQAASG